MWSYLTPLHEALIGFAFSLFGALVISLLKARVKIVYGRANNSRNVVFLADKEENGINGQTEIYVEKYYLQNRGRKAATNVEFVLSSYPNDISVFEPRAVTYTNVEKGQCMIGIPQISPGELVIIDCLYISRPAARVSSVKCAEAMGTEKPFWTVQRFAGWFNYLVAILIFLGLAFLIQIVFQIMDI